MDGGIMIGRQLALWCALLSSVFSVVVSGVPAAAPVVPVAESFWARVMAPKLVAAKNIAIQNPWTSVGVTAASVTAISLLNQKRNCKRFLAELQAIKAHISSDQKDPFGRKVPLIENNEQRKHIVLGLNSVDYGIVKADYEQFVRFLGVYDDSEDVRAKDLAEKEKALNLLIQDQENKYKKQLQELEAIELSISSSDSRFIILSQQQRDVLSQVMFSVYGGEKHEALIGLFADSNVSRFDFVKHVEIMKPILRQSIEKLAERPPHDVMKNPELYGVSQSLCNEIMVLRSDIEVRSKLMELIDRLDNQVRYKNNELNSDVVTRTAAAGSIGVAGYGLQKAWEWWNTPSAQRPQMTWASTAFRWIARTMENHPRITTAIGVGVGCVLLGAWWLKRKLNKAPEPKKLPQTIVTDAPRPVDGSGLTPLPAYQLSVHDFNEVVEEEKRDHQMDEKHHNPYEHHVVVDDETGQPD